MVIFGNQVRRAAPVCRAGEDGWGQPSLPALGQALSPKGAAYDSPGRELRVAQPKGSQALMGRHHPIRRSDSKALRSTALHEADAFLWLHSPIVTHDPS